MECHSRRCWFMSDHRYMFDIQPHDWSTADKANAAYIERHPYAKSIEELVVYMSSLLPSERRQKYIIVTDNYFTSPAAYLRLLALGHHGVGTIKSRSGIPQWLLWKKKDSRRPSGTARFLRSTDKKLLLQEWQDSGLVRVLSTGVTASACVCLSH